MVVGALIAIASGISHSYWTARVLGILIAQRELILGFSLNKRE
jgi:hypothetical protein